MMTSHTVHRETDMVDTSTTGAFGKTRDELDFWINCIGVPLLVLEKQALTIRALNRSARVFFGLGPETVIEAGMTDLIGVQGSQMLAQIWSNAPVGTPGEPFLVRGIVQGQARLLMIQVSKLIVEGETLRLFTFTDAPPEGSVALAGWQENIIDMLNWLPFGFEIASSDNQIQFANSQFNALFGYSQEEIDSIEDWWRLAYPDPTYRHFARSQWEKSIAEARAEDREMTPFDLEVATANGKTRTIQFRHRSIGVFNINLYLDVTQERAYARQLKVLSETDPLTGAMNRRHFFHEADEFLTRQPAPLLVVLMLDIDHFKQINDIHGHGVGDEVLREFTCRCRQVIRKDDIFARLGGEEFAILTRAADVDEVKVIAERIRSAIGTRPFQLPDLNLKVTVSIGGAIRTQAGSSVQHSLTTADKALYAAKRAGRDRAVIEI